MSHIIQSHLTKCPILMLISGATDKRCSLNVPDLIFIEVVKCFSKVSYPHECFGFRQAVGWL